jgi:8-oxo-dGTP pyrophosphatase MutT (NUDIX family)
VCFLAEPRVRKLVVAGLIIGDDQRILITQRRADQAMPLQWEFPGGKVEAGEDPVAALARELAEELGVIARVGRIWDVLFHAYPAFDRRAPGCVGLPAGRSTARGASRRRGPPGELTLCL